MSTNSAPPVGRAFDRVLIIMFENMYRSYVMQNPFMRRLAGQGIDLANSHGVMHPSQTNYIASIAGELCNVSDDERPAPLPQQTIVDLLESAGLSWKAYMDSYDPETTPWKEGLVPADRFPYVIKHNPFSSFQNILDSSERWSRIVSMNQLFVDAAAGSLPAFSWLTPDMWSDGHYLAGTKTDPPERAPVLVDQQAAWLEYLLRMLRFPGPDSILPAGTLVVITYDEADFAASYDNPDKVKYTYDGPNQIYTVLLGDMIEPGVETGAYNHYSLLRTIEVNFGLDSLGKNDRDASWYQFLWGRRFAWDAPRTLPHRAAGPLGLALHQGIPTLVFRDATGQLLAARSDASSAMLIRDTSLFIDEIAAPDAPLLAERGSAGRASSLLDSVEPPRNLREPQSDHPFAVATLDGVLGLAEGTAAGITWRTLDDAGFSPPVTVVDGGPVGALALAAFDGGRRLMLCWSDASGQLFSLTHDGSAWATQPVDIGFQTGGAVTLAVLGSCIFCIFEARQSDAMMAVTMNTADFNVVTLDKTTAYSGPYNNTTKDRWSPSAFPVERFASAPSPVSPGEPEPVTITCPGRGPLASATLDGVIHLGHGDPDSSRILTETMSISGLLTPKLPVSYAVGAQTTTSNGYGTLAQAGWSTQPPIPDATLSADRPALAMCASDEAITLAHVTPAGDIALSVGRYTTTSPSQTAQTPDGATMSQYLKPNPDAWKNIDHIVVVMLENRSFDCMLGWLYDQTPPPRDQHFEGLTDDISNNLEVIDANGISSIEQVYARRNGQPPTKGTKGVRQNAEYPTLWNLPAADPGEGFRDTNSQMFERWDVANDYPPDPTMGGFVQNYQSSMVYSSSVYGDDPVNPRQIMAAYTPGQLPVLSGLAQAYAVCDHWHCSVPSQTWPNRAFAFAATSEGNVNNRPDWVIKGETIFDRLQDAIDGTGGKAPRTDLSWAIYSGTQNDEPFSLTKIMLSDDKQKRFAANFKGINQFYADARSGELPSYTFLEPQFSGTGQNDQKPPSDVRPGEVFIARIYEALRTSPQWERTLLVITYDEHGGCHDHVAPPWAHSPDGRVDAQFGFSFNRFGGRVPAVVVSPRIEPGTVGRPSGYVPFDHTSIIASIRNCFDLGDALTERDKAAPDLSCLLTLDTPRTDSPTFSPPSFDDSAIKEVETGLQRMVAQILGRRLQEEQGVGESLHDFLIRLSRANDAILGDYDLTVIKGIGPVLRTALNRAGIVAVHELAALSEAEIDALDAKLEIPFKNDASEIRSWVAQAKAMVASGAVPAPPSPPATTAAPTTTAAPNTRWSTDIIHQHAQAAVQVELYTLPLYVTAFASIDPAATGDAALIRELILSVTIEEMLHLELASNLCLALGTTPLFEPPRYDGTTIPFLNPSDPATGSHKKLVSARLDRLNEATLQTMLDIETPEELQAHPGDRSRAPVYPYSSIGEMYSALLWGILHGGDPDGSTGPGRFPWKADHQATVFKLVSCAERITSYAEAVQAVTLICEQGEGADGATPQPPYRPDDFEIPWYFQRVNKPHSAGAQYAHFGRFLKVQELIAASGYPATIQADPGATAESLAAAQRDLQQTFQGVLDALGRIWRGEADANSDPLFWAMPSLTGKCQEVFRQGGIPCWTPSDS